jgi:hypothetical protein
VFTARYALSPYIKQTRFVFKGLINTVILILYILNKADFLVIDFYLYFYSLLAKQNMHVNKTNMTKINNSLNFVQTCYCYCVTVTKSLMLTLVR